MVSFLKKIKYLNILLTIILLLTILYCYNEEIESNYSIINTVQSTNNIQDRENKIENIVGKRENKIKNLRLEIPEYYKNKLFEESFGHINYIPDWSSFILGINVKSLLNYSNGNIDTKLNLNLFNYYLELSGINIYDDIESVTAFLDDIILKYNNEFIGIITGNFNKDKINEQIISSIKENNLSLTYTKDGTTYIFTDRRSQITYKLISNNKIIISTSSKFNEAEQLIATKTEPNNKYKEFLPIINKVYNESGIWITYKPSNILKEILINSQINNAIDLIDYVSLRTLYLPINNTNTNAYLTIVIVCKNTDSQNKLYNILLATLKEINQLFNNNKQIEKLFSSINIDISKNNVINIELNTDLNYLFNVLNNL